MRMQTCGRHEHQVNIYLLQTEQTRVPFQTRACFERGPAPNMGLFRTRACFERGSAPNMGLLQTRVGLLGARRTSCPNESGRSNPNTQNMVEHSKISDLKRTPGDGSGVYISAQMGPVQSVCTPGFSALIIYPRTNTDSPVVDFD